MSLNFNKKIVLISVIFMFVLSISLAWIMAKNYELDVNKERYKLSKDLKVAQDADYEFNFASGKSLYQGLCARCHGDFGEGSMTAPPLKGALLLEDSLKTLKVVIYGMNGEIIRNEKTYNTFMPPFRAVTHKDLAEVINYIRKDFIDNDEVINPVKVIETKIDFIERNKPWTEEEL